MTSSPAKPAVVPVTKEIAAAIGALDEDLLRDSLKSASFEIGDENPAKRYQLAVLECGLRKFISKLEPETLQSVASVVGVPSDLSDLDTTRRAIEDAVRPNQITEGLTKKADDKLLQKFCDVLGLESSRSKDDDIKQIEDEVMLSGMESFLNQVPDRLLKSHCAAMKLQTQGQKAELVERLMVHIFELEPLAEVKAKRKVGDDKAGSKGGKKGDNKGAKAAGGGKGGKKRESEGGASGAGGNKPKKKAKKEASGESEDGEAAGATEGGGKAPKAKKTPSKEAAAAAEGEAAGSMGPKGKWQAPPLDTIAKGHFDSYQKLYDNFNLPDLIEYCKLKGIPSSSLPKPKLIKRILHFLETGETSDAKKSGKKGGSKKTAASTAGTGEKEEAAEKETGEEK